ncbi:hypothetical protein ACOTC4_23540, partial [Achromobacter xylosoxidans]
SRKPSDSPICNYFSSAVTQQEGIYLNSNAQNFARRFILESLFESGLSAMSRVTDALAGR